MSHKHSGRLPGLTPRPGTGAKGQLLLTDHLHVPATAREPPDIGTQCDAEVFLFHGSYLVSHNRNSPERDMCDVENFEENISAPKITANK